MKTIKRAIKLVLPRFQKLILEYKVDMRPRWGYGLPAHPGLYAIINRNRSAYKDYIGEMLRLQYIFDQFKTADRESDDDAPAWNNGFLPGLDIVALYTMLAVHKPRRYIEIGSGNSTKVARRCISHYQNDTRIISIDPFPRANIDHLADEVIRKPFEKVSDFMELARPEPGDIVFVDNSHRVLPNSDATAFFLEVLPLLKPGVIVHIHDIYLPYDYPQDMCDRFYSEQYMLAAFLLANPERYEVLFPGIFVSQDRELSALLDPLWQSANTRNVEKHGGSFWFRIRTADPVPAP